MTRIPLILIGLLLLMSSCSNQASTETVLVDEELIIAPLNAPEEILKVTPVSYLNDIRDRTDGIEATMYDSGASFAIFEKNSAYAFFQNIVFRVPLTNTKNQIGHIMFLANGENILLAKVYNNGTDVFIKIEDEETEHVYYSILIGRARDMFTKIKVQKAP